MSVKSIRSNFALTVVSICVGVATLGFCSVIPLASSVTNVVVHPLSVKGLSSTTSDDPAVSNAERSSFADCGVANDVNRMADGKIIGGVETASNEFPWQAYLQVEMENGIIYSCTGSLVSERWILTAASCAKDATVRPNESEKTRSILVYLGLHNLSSSSTEATWKMYEGQGLLLHSGWDWPNDLFDDIALVYLSTAVTFTQNIRPVCLTNAIEPSYVGEYATVTGWGSTSDSLAGLSGSVVLHKVTVPVISNAQCDSYYTDPTFQTPESMMCTSGANSKGICNGDSGAPLIFKQLDGTWKQIGIGSYSLGRLCPLGPPSVYTRLSSYSTWVQQIIAPGSDFSTTPLMILTTTTIKTTPTATPTTTSVTTAPSSSSTVTISSTSARTTRPTSAPSSGSQTFSFLSLSLVSISFLLSCVIQSN